ncbi:hypothetical protein RSOLAG1IB_12174 [Rhizoctonia solani AG-1 IB]|uniref:Uncharacterized protein n=1 Tax=Thanatephorus cucumeris (strain AG1-IB / isolate 7/3/14) TaxID=1108050 RepID=A0A0B7FP68_THACB|nr:hypothetical protein RSOLAG1IB_12174 [Rhizoctonia solani AG-1 IB]
MWCRLSRRESRGVGGSHGLVIAHSCDIYTTCSHSFTLDCFPFSVVLSPRFDSNVNSYISIPSLQVQSTWHH